MSYHHPRQTDQHVAQIYDLIIDQVVEDLTPKLQDEGIDTSVLHNIKQLWREKLQTSFDINMGGGGYAGGGSDFRGGMQMRASGGDFHAMSMYGNAGISGVNGLAMPAQGHHGHSLPHGSEVFLHGVRMRETGLPQTDGSADLQGDSQVADDLAAAPQDVPSFLDKFPFSCPSAAANRRLPRKGDEISLTLSFGDSPGDSNPVSMSVATALEQIDGFGSGPKRRKTGEETYEEDGADGAEDDDDDGGGDNEDEDLNSDDDDDEDAEIERTTEHVILCRYDKVARQKQKWKSQFRDGMMRAKGRDFLFKKATGDMNFQK